MQLMLRSWHVHGTTMQFISRPQCVQTPTYLRSHHVYAKWYKYQAHLPTCISSCQVMDLHRHNVLILQHMGVNQQTQDEQLTLLVMMRRRRKTRQRRSCWVNEKFVNLQDHYSDVADAVKTQLQRVSVFTDVART